MSETVVVTLHNENVDVSSVMKWHPGGSLVLRDRKNADITDLFDGFHPNVKYSHLIVKQASSYQPRPTRHVADFRKLHMYFKRNGWYDPSPVHFASCTLFCLILLAFSLFNLVSNHITMGAIFMGLFWQQTAGLGHDLGHSSCFQKRRTNMIVGSIMSSVTGLSSAWWRHSHFQHHIHTNVREEDPDIIHLPIFSISHKILEPFYHNFLERHIRVSFFSCTLVRIQHITLYPILLFARLNLYVQSIYYILNRADVYARIETVGISLFFLCHLLFVRVIGIRRFMVFFVISHAVSGLLHVQIVISHWSSNVKSLNDESTDLFLHTLHTTSDIECHHYFDKFHLGLQFQVAHHMFPRLPRCRLREATDMIKIICKAHGLPYHSASFISLNKKLLTNLSQVARLR